MEGGAGGSGGGGGGGSSSSGGGDAAGKSTDDPPVTTLTTSITSALPGLVSSTTTSTATTTAAATPPPPPPPTPVSAPTVVTTAATTTTFETPTSSMIVSAFEERSVASPAGSTSSSTSGARGRSSASTVPMVRIEEGERRLSLPSPAFNAIEQHFVFRPPPLIPKNGKTVRTEMMDLKDVLKVAVLRNKYLRNAFRNMPGWRDLTAEIEKFFDTLDVNDFNEMSSIVQRFASAVKANKTMFSGQTLPSDIVDTVKRAEPDLLKMICELCYQRAVPDANALNRHYEAFSSQVYGETSMDQLALMIKNGVFKDGDVFVDLGAGIGNIVVYMAGALKMKKVVGIEISDYPSECAERMRSEYTSWMKWFGKEHQPFELHHGDFMDDKFRPLIMSATVLFINNYAFNSDLEERIKSEIIHNLNDGTRIVSTKPYARLGREATTDRDLSDVTSMLAVAELQTVEMPASWTHNTVHFYLHTVDLMKIQRHFDQKQESSHSSHSRESSRKSSKSRSASSTPSPVHEGFRKTDFAGADEPGPSARRDAHRQGDDDDGPGPTTRRGYKEFEKVFSENKKRTAKVAGSEAPKWDEEDFEYQPPVPAKKAKKEPKPRAPKPPAARKPAAVKAGRMGAMGGSSTASAAPRSIMDDDEVPHSVHGALGRLPPARLSGEAREGLSLLHNEIIAHNVAEPPLPDPEDASLVLTRIPQLAPPLGLIAPEPTHVRVILDTKDPVDCMLLAWRAEYRTIMHQLQNPNPAVMHSLTDAIAHEKERQKELREKERATLAAIENLLSTANMHLRARLRELDMNEVETPSELLNLSKMIVARHKEITYQCSMLESEVTLLESRLRAAHGSEVADRLIELTYRNELSYEEVANALFELGVLPVEHQKPEIIQAAQSSRAARPHARPRPRPSGPKRSNAATAARTAPTGDSEQSEDIDRKVKEFVARALEVESQAKEKDQKERRQRGSDKKKSSSASSLPGGAGPSSSILSASALASTSMSGSSILAPSVTFAL